MQNPIENRPDLYIMLFLNIKKGNPQACNINEPPHDKTNNVAVRPAKTQISLDIRPVWSESSLSAWRKLVSLATHWAQSKTLIRLGGCPGWSESSLGALIFWFCHEVAQITLSETSCRENTTKFTKLYIELHAFLYHQNINHTKEICFNDDALVALLPKGVCFVKYYFSSLRYRNFMWSADQKNVFIPFN